MNKKKFAWFILIVLGIWTIGAKFFGCFFGSIIGGALGIMAGPLGVFIGEIVGTIIEYCIKT